MSDLNKMLLVNSNTVETYEYNVKYMVDIITNKEDGVYEVWFYFPDCGMKNEIDCFPIDQFSKEDVIKLIEYYIKKDAHAYEQDLDDLEETSWNRMKKEKEMYRRIFAAEDKAKAEEDDDGGMCEGLDDGDDCKTCERYSKEFKQS